MTTVIITDCEVQFLGPCSKPVNVGSVEVSQV